MWEDKNYFRWVNQLSPFHGELVGFSHCDSTYYQARKESDVTVLEYVTKGTGTLKVNALLSTHRRETYICCRFTPTIYTSRMTTIHGKNILLI